MASLILVLAILGQPSAAMPMVPLEPRLRLWAPGPDHASGSLINCTVGCQPGSPLDPSRPSVVVVHGINPVHTLMHSEIAQRYGEAIGARWGTSINVLGWDWNGDTLRSLRPSRNEALAELQGRALAEALVRAGVAPDRLHLVGHSSGGLVAAAARGHHQPDGEAHRPADPSGPGRRAARSDLRHAPGRERGEGRQPLSGPRGPRALGVPLSIPTFVIRPCRARPAGVGWLPRAGSTTSTLCGGTSGSWPRTPGAPESGRTSRSPDGPVPAEHRTFFTGASSGTLKTPPTSGDT